MRKWILGIVLIVVVFIGYKYIYQDHRNIGAEMPEFTVSANDIINEFENDMSSSEKKYLNKTVSIAGLVTDFNTTQITLNSKVFCQLHDTLKTLVNQNSKIKIKGRVIGYDELLEQVKLDQCTITKY